MCCGLIKVFEEGLALFLFVIRLVGSITSPKIQYMSSTQNLTFFVVRLCACVENMVNSISKVGKCKYRVI